jgi:hypothetical protein
MESGDGVGAPSPRLFAVAVFAPESALREARLNSP